MHHLREHSLINLFRMLGGTLSSRKAQSAGDRTKTAKCNLELVAKVHEISATEVSLIIESMTRLSVDLTTKLRSIILCVNLCPEHGKGPFASRG
jgi:hypothetical protein